MEITAIGQYAVILKEGKILLLKRTHSGNWSLPGGRIEKAIEPYSELQREIREELDTSVISSKPVDVAIFNDEYQIKYAVIFLVEIYPEDIKISNEHSEYKYFSKLELGDLDSIDGYAELKERVLKILDR